VTENEFQTENPQTWGDTVQNLVATAT
jgi:hypothetical protein